MTAHKHGGVPFIKDLVGVLWGEMRSTDEGPGCVVGRLTELTLTKMLSAKEAGLSTSVNAGGPVPMIFQRM